MISDPGRVVGRGRMRLPTQDRVRRREFWELLVVNWQLSSSVMIDACPRESPGICGIFSTMPLVGWVQCSEPHRPSAERWGDKRRTALSDVRRGEEEAVRTIGGLRSRGSRVREPYQAQGLLALLWWCRHGNEKPRFLLLSTFPTLNPGSLWKHCRSTRPQRVMITGSIFCLCL